MVSWIELKTSKRTDPFQDPKTDSKSTQDTHPSEGCSQVDTGERTRWDFETAGSDAAGNRGQLAAYAAALMDSRWRLHTFALLIYGTHARFMRWDRSAAIVSAKFNYKKQPEFLADFLWRLNHASEDVLGFDSTIKPFEDASFRRHFPGYEGPLYQVIVPSREGSGQGEAYVIPTQDLRRLTVPVWAWHSFNSRRPCQRQ